MGGYLYQINPIHEACLSLKRIPATQVSLRLLPVSEISMSHVNHNGNTVQENSLTKELKHMFLTWCHYNNDEKRIIIYIYKI